MRRRRRRRRSRRKRRKKKRGREGEGGRERERERERERPKVSRDWESPCGQSFKPIILLLPHSPLLIPFFFFVYVDTRRAWPKKSRVHPPSRNALPIST